MDEAFSILMDIILGDTFEKKYKKIFFDSFVHGSFQEFSVYKNCSVRKKCHFREFDKKAKRHVCAECDGICPRRMSILKDIKRLCEAAGEDPSFIIQLRNDD